jgi:hypothetical protein
MKDKIERGGRERKKERNDKEVCSGILYSRKE